MSTKADIENIFGDRIRAQVAKIDSPEAPPADLTNSILDLFLGLMDSCLSPQPADLATALNKPTALMQRQLIRQARKAAVQSGMSRKAGEQAADVLLAVGREASPEDCKALVDYTRNEITFEMI